MTLVTTVLDRAARRCSVTPPGSWSSATNTEHVEIRDDFFLETIDNVRDRLDLPSPIGKQTTITGDGSESYALPANFLRLARDPLGVYETTTLRRAGTPVATDGLWTHLNQIGGAGAFRYYRIEGFPGEYTIKFENDLATGDSVTVSYVSDVIVEDSGGTESNAFDADTDKLLFPRRLIETGIVARFRERRGLDYVTAQMQFEAEMSRIAIDAVNLRTIAFGPPPDDFKPMRVPVPDYIPSS